MASVVKHYSLHRIGATELRVVADDDEGIIPLVQLEARVIEQYARRGAWRHSNVTLFILEDLRPLLRQLPQGADLQPGQAAMFDHGPVVSAYDLANPAACHVFVNRKAMVRHGYWSDLLAVEGLLAHEHGHPLAENETTRASRRLSVSLECDPAVPAAAGQPAGQDAQQPHASVCARTSRLLDRLATRLCLLGPREVFANDAAITNGFEPALLHLDRRNLANVKQALAGREVLRRQLQREVAGGRATDDQAAALMLVADLDAHLDLAMETAPFFRTGHTAAGCELEAELEAGVFTVLEPPAGRAYSALREHYIALQPDVSDLQVWASRVLGILAETVGSGGLALRMNVHTVHA